MKVFFRLLPKVASRVALAAALLAPVVASAAEQPGELFYIGMHGEELRAARLNPQTGELTGLGVVASGLRPTWAVADKAHHRLYVTNEQGNDGKSNGGVVSFAVNPATGELTKLGEANAGGGGTTFLWFDAPSATVLATNFGGHNVVSLPVGKDGALEPMSGEVEQVGHGPLPRQQSAHPHSVLVDPTGRWAIVADMGADRVFVHRFDRKGHRLLPDPKGGAWAYVEAPATGPRHMVLHPNGRLLYLADEVTGGVQAFRWNAALGTLTLIETLSTNSPGFTGESSSAELALSPDGRFLYFSNRGEQTLVTYAVNPLTGRLTLVQRLPAGGTNPWSFALSPSAHWLVVTNEASGELRVFARDKASGKLTDTGHTLASPHPVSVTFAQ